MPAVKLEKINNNSFWCLWEITESPEQMFRNTILGEEGKKEIESVHHPIKQIESLASRRCIQEIMNQLGVEYCGMYKDAFDKPHLLNKKYFVSISHSYPYAVGILHKRLPVGIDIEKPKEKLLKISNRFLNETEWIYAGDDINKLCVYWTGKEAIYKLNGKKGLSFKKNIVIHPFQLKKRDVIKSELLLEKGATKIAINYRYIKGYYISFCF